MCNHTSIPDAFKDIDHDGPVPFTWEGSEHGEKGTQTAKEEFVSQNGNFGKAVVKKRCTKKVSQHLTLDYSNDIQVPNRFKT